MYFTLELLALVSVVAVLGTLLFTISAALVVLMKGMRSVLRLSAGYIHQVARFRSAIPSTSDLRLWTAVRRIAHED